jgi:pSer/pThr/pTyr-binding forkhead associated (FHA) protein
VREYLTVGAGSGAWQWPLPDRDTVTIGRDPGCDLSLQTDGQLSRYHAELQRSDGQWLITDRSTNGSYVNGQRISRKALNNGDRLRLGSSELTFHTAGGPALSQPPAGGGEPRRPLGNQVVVTGVLEILHLGLNSLLTFVTDLASGPARWIISQAAVVVIAMVMTGASGIAERKPARPEDDTAPQRAGRRTGRSGLAAVLVVLLVVGAGGFAVTKGIQAAVDYTTGKQTGTDRLVREVTKSAVGLTLTVVKVEDTSNFTRVELTVRNTTSATTLVLPLFNNCVFTAADGTTLQADTFKSQWSDSIAPGAFQRGTITFPGHLPDTATRASLTFAHVFGTLGAISISGIQLTPKG